MIERARAGGWQTLGRHQLGALIATAVDFATMILAVERAGLPAAVATAIGATAGAVANFALGRAWVFRLHAGHWTGQAARYALVSGASAAFNTLGEWLLHDTARVAYVPARLLVSLAVSLLWNFPVQRRFVFRESTLTLEVDH
jgi:putative flippase GtrA